VLGEIPPGPDLHFAVPDQKRVARPQLADTGNGGQGAGKEVVEQVAPQGDGVHRPRHPRVGQQRPQLRGEDQLAIPLPVEERLLTGAIAGQLENLLPLVPDREGEHPVEALDEVRAVLLVHVGDDLGVHSGAEAVAEGLQLGPHRPAVVDLAVAGAPDRLVLVGKRRGAGLDVDDGQAAKSQVAVSPEGEPLAIRPPVGQRGGHPAHDGRALRIRRSTPEYASQAAHEICSFPGELRVRAGRRPYQIDPGPETSASPRRSHSRTCAGCAGIFARSMTWGAGSREERRANRLRAALPATERRADWAGRVGSREIAYNGKARRTVSDG